MNSLSLDLIVFGGFLFGVAFPFLLEELGFSRKASRSWLSVFCLAFLAFVAFISYPVFTHGLWVFPDVGSFYNDPALGGVFLWFTVALLAGGGVVVAAEFLTKRGHAGHAQHASGQ